MFEEFITIHLYLFGRILRTLITVIMNYQASTGDRGLKKTFINATKINPFQIGMNETVYILKSWYYLLCVAQFSFPKFVNKRSKCCSHNVLLESLGEMFLNTVCKFSWLTTLRTSVLCEATLIMTNVNIENINLIMLVCVGSKQLELHQSVTN